VKCSYAYHSSQISPLQVYNPTLVDQKAYHLMYKMDNLFHFYYCQRYYLTPAHFPCIHISNYISRKSTFPTVRTFSFSIGIIIKRFFQKRVPDKLNVYPNPKYSGWFEFQSIVFVILVTPQTMEKRFLVAGSQIGPILTLKELFFIDFPSNGLNSS